jgi:hypothetical protein
MSTHRLLAHLTLVTLLGVALGQVPSIQAQSAQDAEVVVVEDKTVERGCMLAVQDAKVAESQTSEELADASTSCPPGTLLVARVTTLDEIQKAGIKDYVVLTGDAAVDRVAVDALFAVIRSQNEVNAPPVTPLATCTAATRTATSSYAGNGGTNYSQFTYTVQTNCSLVSMSDKAKTTSTWTSNCWLNTTIRPTTGGSTWVNRGMILYSSYTTAQAINIATKVGDNYAQEANNNSLIACSNSSGFTLYSVSYAIPN